MAIAEPSDVARILQESESSLPGGTEEAIAAATSWAKDFLRSPDLGEDGPVVTSHWDVRDDGFIYTQGTPTQVEVRDLPESSYRVLASNEWTYDTQSEGVKLRPPRLYDSERDPRYGPEMYPRIYVEVRVTQTVSGVTDQLVIDGVAHAAAALIIRSPRAARGVSGETIGDYSYRTTDFQGKQVAGHPFFEIAKSLLRTKRRGGAFVP